MHEAKVQRESALPLYHQIFAALRDEILSGALPFGASLPTEFEISDRFGVSRITARRAMQELTESGLVERRRRVGTRVIHKAKSIGSGDDRDRTIDTLIAFGRETVVKLIEYGRVPASVEVAAALELEPGTEIVRALRLRSVGSEPLGMIESVLPLEAAELVSAERLSQAPLLEILRASGQPIVAGQQVISSVGAGLALAGQLGLEPQAPVLRVERLLRTVGDKPIARTVAQYRGDRYRLALDLEAVPHPLVTG
jgi:GntR family transcriptional regulator